MPLSRPQTPARRFGRWIGLGLFVLILAFGVAWSATALAIHLTGTVLWVALFALSLAAILAVFQRWQSRRRGWAVLLVAAGAVGLWYQTLQPQQDRNWAPDVAHGVSYTREGSIVTLQNIRNFDWQSESDAVPQWETRSYDLTKLSTVDMITSVWDNPEIAHLIVSFGFTDGDHVAFSLEIRKEAHESFSTVGGFFRQFELVLIAATENDIVRLRTNQRREDVHLFPVKLNAAQRETLFLRYLDFGNELAETPQFYNTVTANCTSVVYRLVQVIKPDIPLSLALLYSGRLPEYLDGLGGLPGDMPMEQRRSEAAISTRAQGIPDGAEYSAYVREAG